MATRKYSHVAVLMGGLSAEREVSLNSGKACAYSRAACASPGEAWPPHRSPVRKSTSIKPSGD